MKNYLPKFAKMFSKVMSDYNERGYAEHFIY